MLSKSQQLVFLTPTTDQTIFHILSFGLKPEKERSKATFVIFEYQIYALAHR